MNELKKCTCGAEMKSRGVNYLVMSSTRIFVAAAQVPEKVEMFVCPECRRVDFYWMENDMLDEEVDSKQRLYDMYKNEPADKLRKILDNGSYTDECRAVIKKDTFRKITKNCRPLWSAVFITSQRPSRGAAAAALRRTPCFSCRGNRQTGSL